MPNVCVENSNWIDRYLLPLLFVTLSCIAAAWPAAAEEDIIISANRVAQPASEVGSSVTVITGEDLERRGTKMLSEILREVPGVAVSRSGGIGGQTAVRIRGAEANHTLVFIDGVEVNNPDVSQALFEHMTAGELEKIEVVRGAQSVLYGANAIGGVINIVTKKGGGAPSTTGRLEFGSNSTLIISAGSRGGTEKLDFAIDYSGIYTDGISSADENLGNTEVDGYKNTELRGKLGYQVTEDLELDGYIRYVIADSDYDAWGRDSNDELEHREFEGKIQALYSAFDGRFDNTFRYTIADFDRTTEGTLPRSQTRSQRNKLEYQGVYRFSEDHRLAFGGEYETNQIDNERTNIDESIANAALFLEYGFAPMDNLDFVLGGRVDDHEIYGDYYTYRVAGSYLVESTSTRIKGSVGTGFASPTPSEIFGEPSFFPGFTPFWPDSLFLGGNIDLDPETSFSWDLGVVQSFWEDRIELGVTYFENRIDDLVTYHSELVDPNPLPDGTTPTLNVSSYENIDRSFTRGVEVSFLTSPAEGMDLSASYTYQVPKNEETGEDLLRRARHLGSVNLNYRPTERVDTNLGVVYNGAQDDFNEVGSVITLDDYVLVNFQFGYAATENLRLIIRAENLLDEEYTEVYTYGTLGRTFYSGIRLSF